MSNNDSEYISGDEAQQLLGLSARATQRYGHSGRIRTQKAGKRTVYNRSDVETLAGELLQGRGQRKRSASKPSTTGLVSAVEVLDYVRGLDSRLMEVEDQRLALAVENATLKARLQQAEDERDRLRGELERAEAKRATPPATPKPPKGKKRKGS